jgi:hypothetical protein
MSRTRSIDDRVHAAFILAGILVMIGAVLVFFYQGMMWLRWGYWFPYSLGEAWFNLDLPIIMTGWSGIDKIILWISGCQLCIVAFCIGLAFCLMGAVAADRKLGPNL